MSLCQVLVQGILPCDKRTVGIIQQCQHRNTAQCCSHIASLHPGEENNHDDNASNL